MTSPQSTHADGLADWIGRQEVRTDRIDLRIAQALAATLDQDPEGIQEGDALPPLWHWVYFTPNARTSTLGPDGHPARGGFLPPVVLPNRMWAGGRLRFLHPLAVGEWVERTSTIRHCAHKHGRSGDLVFVTVEHALADAQGVALVEEHDIVYRPALPAGGQLTGAVAPTDADYRIPHQPDAVVLFRYSALTFNGHRIHYDHPYVTGTEGYPGLIVHGPLIATWLLEGFRQAHPDRIVTAFEFRAVGPLFDIHRFDVCGRMSGPDSAELWTDENGRLTMKATVTLAPR